MTRKRNWSFAARQLPILLSFLLLTSFFQFPQANAAADFEVSLISPSAGSSINPNLPFTVTIRLTGGSAANTSHCDDPDLQELLLGGQLIDSSNLAQTLLLGRFGRTGDSLSDEWSTKLLSNGLECSIKVGVEGSAFSDGFNQNDSEWFSTNETNWSGNDTNFGDPIKFDFAWKLGARAIQHHVFNIATSGTPKISVIGLQRGDVIDFVKKFQIQAQVDSGLEFRDFKAYYVLGIITVNSNSEDILYCDENRVSKKDSGSFTTYTEDCYLYLNSGWFDGVDNFDIYASLKANSEYKSAPVTLVTGKMGTAGVSIYDAVPKYSGINSKKPWLPPGRFELSGKVSLQCDSGSCSDQNNFEDFQLTICANGVCKDSNAGSDGSYSYSEEFKDLEVTWSVNAMFKGVPVGTLNASSALPKPPAPKTALRVSISNPASMNWGKAVPFKIKLNGAGSATCQFVFAYPNTSGRYTPVGASGQRLIKVTNNNSAKVYKAFIPADVKSRWYVRLVCRDNKTYAYLPWGETFVVNR